MWVPFNCYNNLIADPFWSLTAAAMCIVSSLLSEQHELRLKVNIVGGIVVDFEGGRRSRSYDALKGLSATDKLAKVEMASQGTMRTERHSSHSGSGEQEALVVV